MFFVLPLGLFLVVVVVSAGSFFTHVYFDKAHHVQDPKLAHFAWLRRKQQLHSVHHLHADTNFAVIDFFWDRLLGTYRKADGDAG
jgi:sterol desaturase/sphingolipid hydroxylase (fatty acid hydroxylase superfamily)